MKREVIYMNTETGEVFMTQKSAMAEFNTYNATIQVLYRNADDTEWKYGPTWEH